MYHLTQYPEWQIKVQQEIDQLFGNRDYPEHEDMNNMKVLTMILNESMRMTPVAPTAAGTPNSLFSSRTCCLRDILIGRELKEDVTIDGYFIPKGTSVWAPIYLFHHNPRLWDKVRLNWVLDKNYLPNPFFIS
jgi:cytochrome P450